MSSALWSMSSIDRCRPESVPELERIVVAVDPPMCGHRGVCGIVGAGVATDGTGYVLADASVERCGVVEWGIAVAELLAKLGASCVVAEVSQGGELVGDVLRQVVPSIAVRTVRAARGRYLRAEPIAALYSAGRVKHVGKLAELERQMCDFDIRGLSGGRTPDRFDALVWAITDLMLAPKNMPRIARRGVSAA